MMTFDNNRNSFSQENERSTLIRSLSISGITLAGALAFGSAQAQSNGQCETNVEDDCDVFQLPPISVTPFFTPPDELGHVPFYQPDDPRDRLRDPLSGGGGGSGGGSTPGEDPDEGDTMCISYSVERDFILLSETEQFNLSTEAQASFVAGLAGVAAGGVAGAFTENPLVMGIVSVTVNNWLGDFLVGNPVHCGDRITTEITLCPSETNPIEAFEDAPFRVQAIDTRVDHWHSRCIDDFAPPPPGTDLQSIASFSAVQEFEFTLNGVTHAFENQPPANELREMMRDIGAPKSRQLSPADFDQDPVMDAFERGVEAGIRAYEESQWSAADSRDD